MLSSLLHSHCCHPKILVTSSVGPHLNGDNIWVRASGSPFTDFSHVNLTVFLMQISSRIYSEGLLVTCNIHVEVILVFKELLNIISFVFFLIIPYQMPSGCFCHCLSILINYITHIFRIYLLSPYCMPGTISVAG